MTGWSDERIGRLFHYRLPRTSREVIAGIRAAVEEARREERERMSRVVEEIAACEEQDYICPEHVAAILARGEK